jgi:hypothetical protein
MMIIIIMVVELGARGRIGAKLASPPTSRAKGLRLARRRAHAATKKPGGCGTFA